MKKIFWLIAMTGVLMGAISCSDDDEPKRGDGVFTVNTSMINHMVNSGSDAVIGISMTHNKLTLDTVKHKATLELNYNDGNGDKQLKLEDIAATPKRLGFYELSFLVVMGWSGSGAQKSQGQNLVFSGAGAKTPFYQFPRGE